MSQSFFQLFLILTYVLRVPITLILIILRPLIPFIKKRMAFERKNLSEESSFSFSLDGQRADYCFEISSEGELEQVRPLIVSCIHAQKKIELIYSSPSVESKCLYLYSTHVNQVRLLRLPLISGIFLKGVTNWVTAPVVIFCRYDFFPELLLLKLFKKKFVLISGAFKKTSWYKLSAFKYFDVVVAATDLEKKKFEDLLVHNDKKIYSCDFRVPRIAERFENAMHTLEQKTALKTYLEHLRKVSSDHKIIIGNAWKSDLGILKNPELIDKVKKRQLHLLIVPHKLEDETIAEFKREVAELFGDSLVEVLDSESEYRNSPVVILKMNGVLCELYRLFSLSYVGGGYERSIHSVLEPFFSNNIVVTGPAIHRSTEYDLVREIAPGEIHVLKSAESFYTIIKDCDVNGLDRNARERFRQHTVFEMKEIIKEILT